MTGRGEQVWFGHIGYYDTAICSKTTNSPYSLIPTKPGADLEMDWGGDEDKERRWGERDQTTDIKSLDSRLLLQFPHIIISLSTIQPTLHFVWFMVRPWGSISWLQRCALDIYFGMLVLFSWSPNSTDLYFWYLFVICQQTNTKDIAGQSARAS